MTTTPAEVEKRALAAACTRLNAALHRAAAGVTRRIRLACTALIQGTPEYQSLLSGELRGHLGLEDPEMRLHAILEAIGRSVEATAVPVRAVGGRVEGGMNVGILRSDYEDILSLSEASYVSPPSGEEIPWLHWLIGSGDRVIVYGYSVDFDLAPSERARSRSRMALMRPGGGWRVPPQFAGTFEDNFLTRAFDVGVAGSMIAEAMVAEIGARI